MKCFFSALVVLCGPAFASAQVIEITVAAGKNDRANEPVRVQIQVPVDVLNKPVRLSDMAGKPVTCQLTRPGLLAEKLPAWRTFEQRELHFILTSLKAGETARFKLGLATEPATPEAGFIIADKDKEYSEIRFKDRPILRYMNAPLDESSKEKREETFKVFHHLYDPSGKHLVTKGPGGFYTHHRGLFYGFNKVTYGDGKKTDIWHCPVAYQSHEKFLEKETGPVLARERAEIAWHGVNKEIFATEQRELTVYNIPGGTLVEFASVLRTTDGPVLLDGDPQHAGFHFRAADEVAGPAKEKPAKTNEKTIFIRPDGDGEAGKTRNWPAQKTHVNLPWDAMSFVLGQQRFTAAYLDKPTNPKEARFSERDYGRFGSYFVYEVTKEKPLAVNYRVWLQEGQMKGDAVAALSRAFVEPVQVTAK